MLVVTACPGWCTAQTSSTPLTRGCMMVILNVMIHHVDFLVIRITHMIDHSHDPVPHHHAHTRGNLHPLSDDTTPSVRFSRTLCGCGTDVSATWLRRCLAWMQDTLIRGRAHVEPGERCKNLHIQAVIELKLNAKLGLCKDPRDIARMNQSLKTLCPSSAAGR